MLADGLFVNMDVYSALFVSGLGVIYHCWDSSVVASSGLPSPLGLGPHWLGPYCESVKSQTKKKMVMNNRTIPMIMVTPVP